MSASGERALQKYKEECFKQAMPYGYELAYADDEKKEASAGFAPSGRIILFPDDNANILNFEGINEDYVIFVDRAGVYEPDLVSRILQPTLRPICRISTSGSEAFGLPGESPIIHPIRSYRFPISKHALP